MVTVHSWHVAVRSVNWATVPRNVQHLPAAWIVQMVRYLQEESIHFLLFHFSFSKSNQTKRKARKKNQFYFSIHFTFCFRQNAFCLFRWTYFHSFCSQHTFISLILFFFLVIIVFAFIFHICFRFHSIGNMFICFYFRIHFGPVRKMFVIWTISRNHCMYKHSRHTHTFDHSFEIQITPKITKMIWSTPPIW